MYKLFRFAGTVLLAAALSFRGVSAILADGNDGKTEPVALILRPNSDVEQNEDDDDDTPSPTDDDGFDTPLTDYDGIDTPATDNDGVDTPLSTDGDGINTPYTDYDGVDDPGVPTLRANASVHRHRVNLETQTAAADSYQLWRWEQTNGWRQIGGGNLNAIAYTDENVAPATTYIYTVRAVSGDGESSAWSAYASATAQEPGSLTAAPVLSATAGDEARWTSAGNALPGASRYELWAWDSENGWEQIGGANLTGNKLFSIAELPTV